MNVVKNESIIQASVALFMEKGFTETQMNEIALSARVSKRTLYKYYKNKSEVYLVVLHRFIAELQEFYRPDYHREREFLPELEMMARKKIEYILRPEFIRFTRILIREQNQINHLTHFIAAEAQNVRKMLADWLQKNIDDGKFSSTVPVQLLANYFHQSIEGMIYWPTVMGSRNGFSDEEIDSIVTIIINAFRNEYSQIQKKDLS